MAALQGNLSQNARDRVMEEFRCDRVLILLATNVAARGLDVTHVDQVINFELPESADLLMQRIGRTGRMGRHGRAITLLSPDDEVKWRQLERALGRRVSRTRWAGLDSASVEVISAPSPTAPARSRRDPGRDRSGPAKRADRRWHPIVRSACQRQAEVPFRPDPARLVYCVDSFRPGTSRKRESGGAA